MSTFDQILPHITDVLNSHISDLHYVGPMVINRDLNGRVCIVVAEGVQDDPNATRLLSEIANEMSSRLEVHSFPVEDMIVYESSLDEITQGASVFQIEGFEDIKIADRLISGVGWSEVAVADAGPPKIVFFSIKGGVGRSTALAATAWALAQKGKRVLVLDLDLESPGLSSSILPSERRPKFGITDWLVEDLVDNGHSVIGEMVATSELSHDGEILVAPAYGKEPGEYVAKLGRAWMSKQIPNGSEAWSARLKRLLADLVNRWSPDVVLIDSRAGIDEVASTCITDLGAQRILLFAIDGEQTWAGYEILFRHWRKANVVLSIRERLQIVGSMVPEINGAEYVQGLKESAWDLCADELYDEVPAGEPASIYFNFDENDEAAPHFPWIIRWSRGFAALKSIHSRLVDIDPSEIRSVYGHFLDNMFAVVDSGDAI